VQPDILSWEVRLPLAEQLRTSESTPRHRSCGHGARKWFLRIYSFAHSLERAYLELRYRSPTRQRSGGTVLGCGWIFEIRPNAGSRGYG
jgi:hypothetical protein